MRIDLTHEAVHDPPRRAAGERARQSRLVIARPHDGILVHVGNARLFASKKGRAHLHRRGSERERRGNAAAIHDAARCDDRDTSGVDDLRYERDRANH